MNKYLSKVLAPLLLALSNGWYAYEEYQAGNNAWIAASIIFAVSIIIAGYNFHDLLKKK